MTKTKTKPGSDPHCQHNIPCTLVLVGPSFSASLSEKSCSLSNVLKFNISSLFPMPSLNVRFGKGKGARLTGYQLSHKLVLDAA